MSKMTCKISVYSIQISILIIEAASNLLRPQYSIKIFNTETVNLSLGDPDDAKNNDLEIIKVNPGKSGLDRKLTKFHKYVNLVEMTESPEEKFFFRPSNKFKNYKPLLSISYPDSITDEDEKQLNKPTVRKKKRKKKRLRTMNFQQFKKSLRIKKRQVTTEKEPETEYDYLQKEYFDFVNHSILVNNGFKYTDEGKPEENFKEIIYKIMDVKTPKNCTQITGIGLQAVECIVKNFRSGKLDKTQMIYAIFIIVLVWFGVYLAIAIPLWCTKGWFCCCFRCEFCLPSKTVGKIQKYITQNPPGIYINSANEEEHYNPTQNETELYERLKRSIAEF